VRDAVVGRELVLCRTVETQIQEGTPMRRDELMKPDLLSEVLLLVMGAAIVCFLMLTVLFVFLSGSAPR
jgi:hypothetical protein